MLFLAKRYLASRKRQTILTLLGVFFGTCAFIVLSGFILGFRYYLINQLVNNNGHVFIQSREDFITEHLLDKSFFKDKFDHVFWSTPPSGRIDENQIENPTMWYERLDSDLRVTQYSPQLNVPVILSKANAKVSTTLMGCLADKQMKVTTIKDYMIEGDFSDLNTGGNRIVIGEELSKKLGTRIHQTINVSSAGGSTNSFKVIGIYRTGNKLADVMSYTSLVDVQRLNRTPKQINQIAVQLKDFTLSKMMANNWRKVGKEKVESWDEINASIFNVFKIQDAIRFLTIFSIMIVAGFGMYNVLNITVIQKRKDIAILLSLGFTNKDIVYLFLSQGLILGLTGSSIGVVVGYFICRYLQTVPFGGGPMGGAGYLQISLEPSIYFSAFGFALFATCLASILPSLSAGKLAPIEIIRSGGE